MKAVLVSSILILAAITFGGCETDVPPDPAVKSHGPTGQGVLTQPDKSDDPIIQEKTRVGY